MINPKAFIVQHVVVSRKEWLNECRENKGAAVLAPESLTECTENLIVFELISFTYLITLSTAKYKNA